MLLLYFKNKKVNKYILYNSLKYWYFENYAFRKQKLKVQEIQMTKSIPYTVRQKLKSKTVNLDISSNNRGQFCFTT